MTIVATALWQRLDTPGHDACHLEKRQDGWRVAGTAVFRHNRGPAAIAYRVDCDDGWKTVGCDIRGFIGPKLVRYRITREADAWTLNGQVILGLGHLVDLDLGFTPATNLQQLRRVLIAQSEAAQIAVAWLDVETGELTELAQRYERRSASVFWYEAPSVGYKGMLEISPNGFILHYPALWKAEPAA